MTDQCTDCHRFCVAADKFTLMDDPYGTEPGKKITLCKTCLQPEMETWRNFGWLPLHKVRAAYEEVLAKEMGFVLLEHGTNGYPVWVKLDKKKKKDKHEFIEKEEREYNDL